MMPPGAALPYVSLQVGLSQMLTVTSRRMSGCGPASLMLPHPTTVAVLPAYVSLLPALGRHTARTLSISGTSSASVMMATSLCCHVTGLQTRGHVTQHAGY